MNVVCVDGCVEGEMTVRLVVALAIVAGHFAADWFCQSDWMALNKSKRWDALAWHVLVYTGVLGFVVALSQPPSPYPYTTVKLFGLWVLVNAAAHFVTDAITSRINARLWFVDGAQVKPRALENCSAFINAIGEISIYEAAVAVRRELKDGVVVVFNDKRHWFFVAIGADQLIHSVTLFVTASWWLR